MYVCMYVCTYIRMVVSASSLYVLLMLERPGWVYTLQLFELRELVM